MRYIQRCRQLIASIERNNEEKIGETPGGEADEKKIRQVDDKTEDRMEGERISIQKRAQKFVGRRNDWQYEGGKKHGENKEAQEKKKGSSQVKIVREKTAG